MAGSTSLLDLFCAEAVGEFFTSFGGADMLFSRPVAGLAADSHLRLSAFVALLLVLIIRLVVGGMADGTARVPVFVGTRPVKTLSRARVLSWVKVIPHLFLHIPGNVVSLQASGLHLNQVLLEWFYPRDGVYFVLFALGGEVIPVRIFYELRLTNALAGELGHDILFAGLSPSPTMV